MSKLLAVLLSLSLVPAAALADGADEFLPKSAVDLPPAVVKCLKSCQDKDADRVEKPTVSKLSAPPVAKKIDPVKTAKSTLQSQINNLKARVKALEDQVGLLTKSGSQDETVTLKAELIALTLQVSNHVEFEAKDISAIRQELDELKSRLEGCGRSNIRVAPRAGGLYLASNDGTKFSAATVGARLVLQLTAKVEVDLDADVLLSVSHHPIGTMARAGIGWYFTKHVGMEIGLSGLFAGYSEHLKAKSAFVVGDVGPIVKFGHVIAGVGFLAGAEFDQCHSASAFGFKAQVGYEFP